MKEKVCEKKYKYYISGLKGMACCFIMIGHLGGCINMLKIFRLTYILGI